MWDGTQWVPDVSPTPPQSPRAETRWSNRAANAIAVLIGLALLVPFSASLAGNSIPAALVVAPGNGPAGSSVVVDGSGFPARMKVQLTWDGQRANLPAVAVSRRGTFRVTVKVPTSTKVGSHKIGAMAAGGKGFRLNRTIGPVTLAVTGFTVSDVAPVDSTPKPTPDPTATPKPTPDPTAKPDPTATPKPTAAPTTAPTAAPTATAAPTTAPTTAPTATPDPTATPKPTATPAPTTTPDPTNQPSGPIEVTTDGRVIDGVTITSSGIDGAGISASGTVSNPIENLTIRNCTIKGFRMGIYLRFVKNVTIENCTITDADYAGIAIFSGIGGDISGNTILRIGTKKNPVTGFQANNAYGIMLNRSESSSLTSDPPSQNFMIDHNVVRDVPLWMCMNLHGARNVTFSANTTSGCPRAIFIAGSPMSGGGGVESANVTVTGNRLEAPTTKSGGTTDIEGVLICKLQGGKITNNSISKAYTPPVFDYLGSSVNVTISGTSAF